MNIKNLFIPVLATFLFIMNVKAQPGSLDKSFGINGKITTDIGGFEDHANSVAIQTDGKIVVAGNSSSNLGGTSFDCVLVRYNDDGTLDKTFGNGGKVITDFGSNFEEFTSVIVLDNGKILVVGSTVSKDPDFSDFILAKYEANGTLDNTFGSGGKVITDFDDDGGAYSLSIQKDDKIVIGGFSGKVGGSDYDFALVRYNSDGTLDKAFGNGGLAVTDFSGENDWGRAVLLQGDGKILIAGYSNSSGTYWDFGLARYNNDGTLDHTFDSDGKVTTDFGSKSNDWGYSVAFQSTGKIIVAGKRDNNINDDIILARYNSDGSLDNTFDTDGKIITAIGTYADQANAVLIQNDDKILIGGISFVAGVGNGFALVRYNSDGTLDNSFGTGGKVTTLIGTNGDIGSSLALQKDGKIILVGSSANGTTTSSFDFSLARYLVSSAGINKIDDRNGIEIFPNPTSDFITVKSKRVGVDYSVTDLNGKLCLDGYINNSLYNIDLNLLSRGIYFLVFSEGDKKTFKKIIKE